MSSDRLSLPSGLSARFDQEVEDALSKDPSQPAKLVFIEVWRKLKPEYEAMHQALKQYLSHQLHESSIRATLHSRVKKDDSIFKSIDRREEFHGKQYDNPRLIRNGIHDLVGFRIIVDYPSGLDQSYQLIKKRFSVEGVNTFSSDRDVGVLWKPRFGAYEGRNFQVRMLPEECNAGLSIYYEVLFEIQITSIVESLYNRLAHPLHYKKSSGTLSRQDEMIIDMSHGLSLCYWITIACMEEKLEGDSNTTHENPSLPNPVRIIAGHDPEENPSDLDDLVKATPGIPVISGDRSLRCSNTGSSSSKRTAPSDDTVSIELLLRSLVDLPRENRSDADVWNEIRDKLGLDDEAYKRFVKSFTYDRMNDRKNSIQQRHRNTFEWVFENKEFEAQSFSDESYSSDDLYGDETANMENSDSELSDEDDVPSLANWLQEDCGSLYWVSGKPGSGKSFFMKFIEKDERTTAMLQRWQPQCRIISHYLWKVGGNDQNSFKGLICSLLHQILQDEKAIALRLLRESSTFSHKNDATDWDVEDVKRLLFNALDHSTHPYLVLIDGLDELSKPHDGMNQVFQFLDGLVKLDRVKVCVSSRPESLFAIRFKFEPSLRMQDLTENDIRKYTIDKLSALDLEFDEYRLKRTTRAICYGAEGVFIWVYMVLKEIQQDVEEFDDGWGDILGRVSKLPSDLMELYRDMLSRFGWTEERHVRRAALYFQYIQDKPRSMECNIASLSLAADEAVLESFTRPEGTPCVDKWVQLCEKYEKTLFRISAGLLEIETKEHILDYASHSEGDEKMLPWLAKSVIFIHRTAIDFLEGEEWKTAFGAYAKTPESMFTIGVRVELARHSVTRYDPSPLESILNILPLETDPSYSTLISGDILSLIRTFCIDKSKEFLCPPYSASYENFFIFCLSFYRRYAWAQELVKSSGTYNFEVAPYILLGACNPAYPDGYNNFLRYRVILDILENHARVHRNKAKILSTQHDVTEGIIQAWRTFLLYEVHIARYINVDFGTTKKLIQDIVDLFIKLGVMAQVPRPKYLVSQGRNSGFSFIRDRNHWKSHLGHKSDWSEYPLLQSKTMYIEVNDAWLIQQLSKDICFTREVMDMVNEDASLRIILGNSGYPGKKKEAEFFLVTTNGGTQHATVDSLGELVNMSGFLYRESGHLKTTPIGRFKHVLRALEKIGYDLPDINMAHFCLHEWIWRR
ncbi:hypothetical protein FSHL1_006917 [Fusarium sambucinum]